MAAEIRAITIQRLWQFLAFVSVGLVLSYLIAQYLVRPVRRLVAATQRVAGGEFEFEAGRNRGDEIGELAVAFEGMTGTLRESTEELEKRTAELRMANEQLLVEIEERTQADEALRKAHDELETQVEERTAELRKSEEEARQLARENAVMAEIGRISSLDIDEVTSGSLSRSSNSSLSTGS